MNEDTAIAIIGRDETSRDCEWFVALQIDGAYTVAEANLQVEKWRIAWPRHSFALLVKRKKLRLDTNDTVADLEVRIALLKIQLNSGFLKSPKAEMVHHITILDTLNDLKMRLRRLNERD